MQKTNYSSGPKFFGMSAKKSWFDEGDRCSPGPGTHQASSLHKTNPPVWSTGKDKERDTFLQKYHRPYPPPDRYKIVNLDATHQKLPNYSVPVFQVKQNPNKIDEGSAVDYKPRYNAPKVKYPHYSFGYYFQRDYSTKVPPPDAYNCKLLDKSSFNRTQRSFSVSARPTPYGEEGKYPYVGKYNVARGIQGSKFSIGVSNRPDYTAGEGADQLYRTQGNILSHGKTMGLFIEVPRNKDQEEYPPPDKYNPQLPKTARNIIDYRSKRSQIKNQAVQAYPSPEKYEPKLYEKEQTVSFTKQKRYSPDPQQTPGVGSYKVQKQFQKTLGKMGIKVKKLTQFINPAPSAYNPKEILTKPRSQQPLNYYSHRTDFSKSVTGKKVGPANYQLQKQESLNLGKIGKGYKFEPNRNKNPGPGSYDIPSGIGRLPKYCNGPKKLTEAGFSQIELQRQERIQSERVRYEQRKKMQEEQQQRKLQQLQQNEIQSKV